MDDHVYEVYYQYLDKEYDYYRTDLRLMGGYPSNDSHKQAGEDLIKLATDEGSEQVEIIRITYL